MAAELVGFSHFSVSTSDLERSRDFYCEVLGFKVLEYLSNDRYREVILVHPSGAIVGFQQHAANAGQRFDETVTGMDHFAFRVARPEDLDDWVVRFKELGVKHSPVAHEPYGSVLCFRDPDDIQLELFYRDGHPEPTRLA